MDIFDEVLVITGGAVVVSWLITRVVAEYYRSKAEFSRRQSVMRQKSVAKSRSVPDNLPEWLPDLLERFGLDADEILDSDEMPAELARLLPLAKGFVDSGGLQKLLGGVQTEPEKRPGFEQGY